MTANNDLDAQHGGPALDNAGNAYSWEAYPEQLENARITWRVYDDLNNYGCGVAK